MLLSGASRFQQRLSLKNLSIKQYLTSVLDQGNMLHSVCEDYPSLLDEIQFAAATKYRLSVDILPLPEQGRECPAKLCRKQLYSFDPEASMAVQEFDEAGSDSSLSHCDEMGMRPSEGAIPAESFLVRNYYSPDECPC